MRTITKSAAARFKAQKDEARLIKEEKIAKNLDNVLNKYASHQRDDDEFYVYSQDQLKEDIESNLWDSAIRASDFYGTTLDAKETQKAIDKVADILLNEFRVISGQLDGIGAYEKSVQEKIEHIQH